MGFQSLVECNNSAVYYPASFYFTGPILITHDIYTVIFST